MILVQFTIRCDARRRCYTWSGVRVGGGARAHTIITNCRCGVFVSLLAAVAAHFSCSSNLQSRPPPQQAEVTENYCICWMVLCVWSVSALGGPPIYGCSLVVNFGRELIGFGDREREGEREGGGEGDTK